MPLPPSMETVTVTATFRTPGGDPLTGTVKFTPAPTTLTAPGEDLIVTGTVTMALDAGGAGSVQLLATDADGVDPAGWTYGVQEMVGSLTRSYSIALPAANPVVALADIAPAPPDPGDYVLVPGPTGPPGPALQPVLVNPAASSMLTLPGVLPCGVAGGSRTFNVNNDYYLPILVEGASITFDRLVLEVTTASGSAGSVARLGVVAATTSWQPTGSLIEEFPTVATDALGVVTSTPAGGSRTLTAGRYLLLVNPGGANTGLRIARGLPGLMLKAALGASAVPVLIFAARAHAAFPSTVPSWTSTTDNSVGLEYPVLMRVSAAA